MKKVICILLAVSLMLSVAAPVFAEESKEPRYGTLKVEYSDALGSVERLDVMVKDNRVYADAVALSDRLGYDCIQNGDLVSIYTDNNFFYPNAPLLAVHFYVNESKVAYNPLFGAEYEYTAPAPCIVDENGIWVPLTYTVVLLGGNSTMLDDTLLIQMPQNNVLSIAAMIVNNEDTLSFDWVSHFGYSETTTNVTDGAGRIVTLFSGLLEFDGDAWLSLIDWSAFDKKFGELLVTMFCTNSAEELEESIDQVERLLEVFSEDGKLGEVLRKEQIKIDGDVEKWWNECEDYLKMLESGSGSPSEYNRLYQQFEKAMDRQSISMALGGDNLIYLQDGLSSATNVLDIASILGSTVSYLSEFQQKDDYMFSVLKNYLKRRISTDEVPAATVQAMADHLTVMDLGGVGYSAYRFIEDNWLKCLVDESGMDTLLGAPANILLLAWDIMSGTIPFYSDGLKAVENREISNYAQKVQNDALENLKHLIAKLKNSSSLSAEECVQLSEYCYIYLKACYIARSSAIKSLDNTSEEFQKQIKGKLDVEADINQLTIQYLAVLSNADVENSCYILGFLPENNAEYLNDYSDDALLDNVVYSTTTNDPSNLVTDAYTDAIVDGEWINCYHIPQVNLSGNRGDAFNAKIYDQFYSLLTNDVYQSMEEYDYPYLSEMVYTWGQKDNLVSIVVQTDQTMYVWTDFYVYTISKETGEEISYSELLAVYDLSEADFYNLVKETLTEYWNSRKSDMISFVGEDYYNTLVERTIAEENVKDAIPYINSNGELCFVAYIYSAAGADKYLHLLNTVGTADEGWVECTMDHFANETDKNEGNSNQDSNNPTLTADNNHNNNVVNGSRAVLCGDSVFYFNDMLFQSNTDFTNLDYIGINNGHTLNVSGDYIYFIRSGEQKIAKYQYTSGTYNKVPFCEYSARNLMVYGEYVYFISDELTPNTYSLHRIKIDGTDLKCLFSGNCGEFGCFNIYNDILFFTNADDDYCIYKMNLDGSNQIKLNNQSSNSIVIQSGLLYYTSKNHNNSLSGHIYRMNLDGTNNTMISDVTAYGINVYGDYIYYINWNDSRTIHRMGTDGSNDIRVSNTEDCSAGISICNGILFYKATVWVGDTGYTTTSHMYLDGSDCAILNDSRG